VSQRQLERMPCLSPGSSRSCDVARATRARSSWATWRCSLTTRRGASGSSASSGEPPATRPESSPAPPQAAPAPQPASVWIRKQPPCCLAGPLLDSVRGSSVPPTEPHPTSVVEPYPGASFVNRLVDEYRGSCLWFLRRDYYPESPAAALRVLRDIERYGDRTAFQRAAEVRQWLSRNSSVGSSAS
jgi:hypothetical protein